MDLCLGFGLGERFHQRLLALGERLIFDIVMMLVMVLLSLIKDISVMIGAVECALRWFGYVLAQAVVLWWLSGGEIRLLWILP